MKQSYDDILSRIAEQPAWYDEHGAPRYGDFAPNMSANIYADEVVLLLIRCQACVKEFKVCLSLNKYDRVIPGELGPTLGPTLADMIREGRIHYGDPPQGCCHIGSTMNSVPWRVLEYWARDWDGMGDKVRDAALEIDVRADWAEDSYAGR